MKTVEIEKCTSDELDQVLPFIAAYHAFEDLDLDDAHRRQAAGTLLLTPHLGSIWWVREACVAVGYIALTYGYSIEFGSRDAFIDEFFLVEPARGRGIGSAALSKLKSIVQAEGIHALHLEVARDNRCAQRLYAQHGFSMREAYHLMSLSLNEHSLDGTATG